MNALVPIHGSGGGKKQQQAYVPVEQANNLQGRQIYRTLHLLSEGPIKGFWHDTDYWRDIFLDGTPLRAEDGSYNFLGVTVDFRDGSPGQSPILGVPSQPESLSSVGASVTVSGGPVIRTFNLTNATRVKLLFSSPGLLETQSNGDITGASVEFYVDVRRTGSSGAWRRLANCKISGKTTSTYPLSVTAPTSQAGLFDFRITRTTPDSSNPSKLFNQLTWDSFATIIDRQLEYPGSAVVAINFDAQLFRAGLPKVTFGLYGMVCYVPLNYDENTRTYANSGPGTTGGVWDGVSFKAAYTNNPAWILYNLAVRGDWGLGLYLPTNVMDQWSIYEIAQYCDQSVPDGFGGYEPRYTFNGAINVREEGLRVLQAIASTFRGMIYWSAGKIVTVADMPRDPVKMFGPSNVVNGRFETEESSGKARHSLIRVQWRDPQVQYEQAWDYVENRELLISVGPRENDYEALGCTSRGLARRMGRWVTFTEQYEDKTKRFKTTIEHCDAGPGDVVLINDPRDAGVRRSGRLVACSQNQLDLDAPVTLSAGQTYWARVELPDGTISDQIPVVNGPGTYSTLTLGFPGTPIDDNLPYPGATWMLIGTDAAPAQWRVMAVSEEQDGTYAFTCIRHYPGKYAAVEQEIALSEAPWTIWESPSRPLAPPTNIDIQESVGGIGVTAKLRVIVSWRPSDDVRVRGYEVQALTPGLVVAGTSVTGSSATFEDLTPATMTFQVRAIGPNGMTSAWLVSAATAVDGLVDPPPAPTSLAATAGVRAIQVSWLRPVGRHIRGFEVWKSTNALFSAGGLVADTDATSIVVSGLNPGSTHYFWVRSADHFGQFSNWVGPVNATTSYLVTADIADYVLTLAKFAQSLKPIRLINSTASLIDTDGNGVPTDAIVASIADGGKLYKRTGTGYTAVIVDADDFFADEGVFNSLKAGVGVFGGVKASEIDASLIHANETATNIIVANTAQVKDLIIGTTKFTGQAVTEVSQSDRWELLFCEKYVWTTAVDIWFYVPDTGTGPASFQIFGQFPNLYNYYASGGYALSSRFVLDGASIVSAQRFYSVWPGWHVVQWQIYDNTAADFYLNEARTLQILLVKR